MREVTALRQDSWVFLNEIGRSDNLKTVLWASGFTGGPLRVEARRDSGGSFRKANVGQAYGASLTRITLRG